jgi:hypothetical protein
MITLQPSVSRLSRQCGILNISKPNRPARPVTGLALLPLAPWQMSQVAAGGHLLQRSRGTQHQYALHQPQLHGRTLSLSTVHTDKSVRLALARCKHFRQCSLSQHLLASFPRKRAVRCVTAMTSLLEETTRKAQAARDLQGNAGYSCVGRVNTQGWDRKRFTSISSCPVSRTQDQ